MRYWVDLLIVIQNVDVEKLRLHTQSLSNFSEHESVMMPCLVSQATPWCIRHWPDPTWWRSLPCTQISSTTRTSQDSLRSDKTSLGKKEWRQVTVSIHSNCTQLFIHMQLFACFSVSPLVVRLLLFQSTPLCPGIRIASGTTAKMRTMSATPGSW